MRPKARGARCKDCPLQDQPCAKPEGDPAAKVALLGEAPGAEEARAGRPFVGQSGRLLDTVLARLGQSRDDLWITNTVLCRPPENRTPTPQELECCSARLLGELCDKKRIVTLGATALNALSPSRIGILRRRGIPVRWIGHLDGKPPRVWSSILIPTIHPAYVLRNGTSLTELERDLQKAFERVLRVETTQNDVELRVPKDREEASTFLRKLGNYEAIAVDLETTGLDPFADEIVLLAICGEPGVAYLFPADLFTPKTKGDSRDPAYALRDQLTFTLSRTTTVGHNAKFDSKFLAEQWGVDWFPTFDTMLAHYCLDERQGTHGLKQLATDLLHAPPYADDLKPFVKDAETQGYGAVPLDVLMPYAARDVHYTLQLKDLFEDAFVKHPESRRIFYDITMPVSLVYTEMERTGIPVDLKRTQSVGQTWDKEIASLLGLIQHDAGDGFNPASPKQLKELLYDRLHYPVQISKKTGEPTTDKDALNALLRLQPSSLLANILKHRKLSKLKSTYIDAILEKVSPDGRLRSEFNLHGTITGRPSSHDPNLLNIPRNDEDQGGFGKAVKDCFVASHASHSGGSILIEGDYSQQEVRVLAHYANDDVLRAACASGQDLHTEIAKAMYGKETVSASERFAAKRTVFGLSYGMGVDTLADHIGCTRAEAQEIVRLFFAKMPACRQWQEDTVREASAKGYLETITGRRRRFGLITRETMQEYRNQALNFRIQSTSADITFLALITLAQELDRYDAHIVLSVYDSILVECPTPNKVDVGKLMREVMVSVAEGLIPDVKFAADIKWGGRWGSLKKMELK